jgi:hypothetical protein
MAACAMARRAALAYHTFKQRHRCATQRAAGAAISGHMVVSHKRKAKMHVIAAWRRQNGRAHRRRKGAARAKGGISVLRAEEHGGMFQM